MDAPRLLAMLTALISMAVIFLFKTYADTRFLSLTGSAYLPHLLAAQAVLMMLLSTAYAYLVRRLSPLRLDLLLAGGTVLGGLAAPLLFEQGVAGVFTATMVLLSFPAIANLALWNSAQGVVSGRAIRSFLPRLGAVATGGATLGSLAATQLSIDFGVESLAPVATALTLLLCAVRIVLERHYPNSGSQTSEQDSAMHLNTPTLAEDGRRLITLLVVATLFETLIAGLVDYSFKRELTLALDSGDLAVFLSLFYAATNGTMLLVQWFGASRLFSLHPLSRNTTMTPAAMVTMSLLWLLFPGLWVLAATRFTDGVMRFAMARPCLEISLSPLDRVTRRRWKVLLRGGFAQIGSVCAGLLLLLMTDLLESVPAMLAWLLLLSSLAWLVVQRQVAHRYMQLLAHTIGRKQLSTLQDPSSHRPDRGAIAQLLSLLESPEPETERFTREFLTGLDLETEELIPHLGDPPRPPPVRETIYTLIAARPNPRWGNSLAQAVAEEQLESTATYMTALNALGACRHQGEAARAQQLLGTLPPDAMTEVALAAALYLARVGSLRPTDWTVSDLVKRLLQTHGHEAGLALQGLIANGLMQRSEADELLANADTNTGTESRSAIMQAHALVATPRSLEALAAALEAGEAEAEAAIPLLSEKTLWRLVRHIMANNPSSETRRHLAYCLRFNQTAQSVRETARFLNDERAAIRRTAVRSLLRKRREQLGAPPRSRYDPALDRQLQYFEALVRARLPEEARPASSLFDRELEQRTDEALDELTGLLALSGDPASIVSARRSLSSPNHFLRRQSLDALQEVMRGARQRRLIQLVELYLAPSTPSPEERRQATLDPWLARCLNGSLDDIADQLIALRDTTLFKELDGERLEELVRGSSCRLFAAGEEVIRRGEPGEHLFVVLEGNVEIITGDKPSNRLGYPTVFGELSVLDRGPRSATVVTRTPTRLLRIDRSTFLGLIESYPEVGVGVLSVMAGWLRTTR